MPMRSPPACPSIQSLMTLYLLLTLPLVQSSMTASAYGASLIGSALAALCTKVGGATNPFPHSDPASHFRSLAHWENSESRCLHSYPPTTHTYLLLTLFHYPLQIVWISQGRAPAECLSHPGVTSKWGEEPPSTPSSNAWQYPSPPFTPSVLHTFHLPQMLAMSANLASPGINETYRAVARSFRW